MKTLVLCAALAIGGARGAIIVQAAGPALPNQYAVLDDGLSSIAFGAGFTLGQTYSNVAIFAALYSSSGSESVTAYLTNAIGPAATAANNVAPPVTLPIGPPSDPIPFQPLFSGLTLAPGDYYFILKGENVNPQNTLEWAGNVGLPAVLGSGVSNLTYHYNLTPSPFGPAGNFTVIALTGAPLYSITGDLADGAVPEPSTFALVAAAILGLSRKSLAAVSRQVSHRRHRSS